MSLKYPSNLAPITTINGIVIQTNPTKVRLIGNSFIPGYPTIPNLARGSVIDTTLNLMNNNLAHVCDFTLELKKNNALKSFINSTLQTVRDAINDVLSALGLDPTGTMSEAVQFLKSITRTLQFIQREIIQPIIDFEAVVISYIQQLQNIIYFIKSLPTKILALLRDCLNKIQSLIASVFSDVVSGVTNNELIAAALETAQTAQQTFVSANLAANVLPAQIQSNVGNLITSASNITSQSQLQTIKNGLPSALSTTNQYIISVSPQYQKSTP
jgi:hypothetical protein